MNRTLIVQYIRITLCCILFLLTVLWFTSLSGARLLLRDAPDAIQTHSSDSLSMHFTLTAPAIRQKHALLT